MYPTKTISEWFSALPPILILSVPYSSSANKTTNAPINAGQWVYHNRTNIPAVNVNPGYWAGGYPISYIMAGLVTGSVQINNLSGYNDWDETPMNGWYVAETFPAKTFNWANGAKFYWIIMNGGIAVYRLTIYEVNVYNVCEWPEILP